LEEKALEANMHGRTSNTHAALILDDSQLQHVIESYMSDWRTYVISKYAVVYGLIHCVFVLNSLSGPSIEINILTA